MAVHKALASCSIVPQSERVVLSEALGRVSAEDVLSTDCVPPSMASRFDGIAIGYDRVFASSSSSREGALELLPKDIVSASTGCVLPKGFDTVICKERVTLLDGGAVRTETPINKGQNTIPKGMLQQEGDVLVRKGEAISPLCLEKLANSGYEYVAVNSKPRVSILCCGSNLVPLGMPLNEGSVRESNSHLRYPLASNRFISTKSWPKVFEPKQMLAMLSSAHSGSMQYDAPHCHPFARVAKSLSPPLR